jgi:membrane-associated phospholipid phosphatase
MNRAYAYYFLVIILFSGIANAQSSIDSTRDSNSSSAFEIFRYDIQNGLQDGLDIIKAPAHLSTGGWITAGAIVGGTSLSMLLDNGLRDLIRRNRTKTMNDVTNIGQYYGEVIPAVSLSAGVYAAGLIFNDRFVSLTGRLMGESLLYAGTINILLKVLFSRSRPYNNKGNTDFWNYKFDNAYYSLPSGHTTVAFALSTVLAERINNIYATIGLYTLAALTAYQRMYSDNHWFSDTILGAATGIVISHAVVKMNENDKFENWESHITGVSLIMNQGYGLGFSFAF